MDLKTDTDTGLIEPTFTKADRKSIASVADMLDDLHASSVKNSETAGVDPHPNIARLGQAATVCRAVLAGSLAAELADTLAGLAKTDAAGEEDES